LDALLPPSRLKEALLFAGLNVVLSLDLSHSLTLPEFLLVGQHAIMASLSDQQVSSISAIFQSYDADSSGQLDLNELDPLLTQTIYPSISIEEVSGIAEFWDDDLSGKIELSEFQKLVSRFIRQREQDWNVLCALRELSGDSEASSETCLAAESLAKGSLMTDVEAEELLWSSQRSGSSLLQMKDVLPMILLDLRTEPAKLPPKPPPAESRRASKAALQELHDVYITARRESTRKLREMLAQIVIDLRIPNSREKATKDAIATADVNLSPVVSSGNDMEAICLNDEPQDLQAERHEDPAARLSRFLYEPRSSAMASLWATAILVTVLASVVMLVLEPLVLIPNGIRFGFEAVVTLVFSLELLLRLVCVVVAKVRGRYMGGHMIDINAIVDVVAVSPLYLELALSWHVHELQLVRLNRFLRVTRVFRFVRLESVEAVAGPFVTVLAVIWGIFLHVGVMYS